MPLPTRIAWYYANTDPPVPPERLAVSYGHRTLETFTPETADTIFVTPPGGSTDRWEFNGMTWKRIGTLKTTK